MFSYFPKADPNLDHTGFYVLITVCAILSIILIKGIREERYNKDFIILLVITSIIGIIGSVISFSEWDIPNNKEYTAKFIRFVPEQEKHQGVKGQISYTNRIYCEYELTINNQRILMDCNSKQSPEYIKVYWNNI
jgi:Na+/melibiose symporter-like transporter